MEAELADYIRAVVLGVVQALTEFLPISSSGHLIVASDFLGEEVSSLTFDVALHVGTTIAVIAYFWRDWISIAGATLRDLSTEGVTISRWSARARLGLWLVIATIPTGLVGLFFNDWIEDNTRNPVLVALMFIIFGLVIGAADRWGAEIGRLLDMTMGRAFTIGLTQVLSLIPGVSRSGITIAAARGLGFDRESAARFSFLLSTPIVFAATMLMLGKAINGDEQILWGPMLIGMLVSGVGAALVIKGFLGFIRHRTLAVFVWYRIAVGLGILGAVALGAL